MQSAQQVRDGRGPWELSLPLVELFGSDAPHRRNRRDVPLAVPSRPDHLAVSAPHG
jgi:hypothetical protein